MTVATRFIIANISFLLALKLREAPNIFIFFLISFIIIIFFFGSYFANTMPKCLRNIIVEVYNGIITGNIKNERCVA